MRRIPRQAVAQALGSVLDASLALESVGQVQIEISLFRAKPERLSPMNNRFVKLPLLGQSLGQHMVDFTTALLLLQDLPTQLLGSTVIPDLVKLPGLGKRGGIHGVSNGEVAGRSSGS